VIAVPEVRDTSGISTGAVTRATPSKRRAGGRDA
jgi:hypothetical protein